MSLRRLGAMALLVAAYSFSATAAVTDFAVLFDSDDNRFTGCSVSGMEGVDHVFTTTVDPASARVTGVFGQRCAEGSLSAAQMVDAAGWPASWNEQSGELAFETRFPLSFFQPPSGSRMRVGVVATAATETSTLLLQRDGGPIILAGRPARRRSVATPGRDIGFDGEFADWNGMSPLAVAEGGAPGLRLMEFYGFTAGNFVVFRFAAQASPDAPTAADDQYNTTPGTPLTVGGPGILGNDTDPRGLPLTASLVDDVRHGTLVLNADGSFSYTDDGGARRDYFSYRASNGAQQSNIARVDIGLSEQANRPPVTGDDSYLVPFGGTLSIIPPGVLANDNDPDLDPLQAVLQTDPAEGSVVLNADGSFTYVHGAASTTPDRFTYHATDGIEVSRETTVHLNVVANSPPTAADDHYTLSEGDVVTVSAPGVLGNDSDPEGATLAAALLTQGSHGTVSLSADGSFTYVHDGSETSNDAFTYSVSDGGSSATATVNLTIAPSNDAPVPFNDSYTVAEDALLNVAAPGVLANDTDDDSLVTTAILASSTSNGSLILNANGSFSYTPNANFYGTDSFTYRAGDGAATSLNAATVTITVTPVNDLPVAVADAYTTDEDVFLNVPVPGVLVNDTDVEGPLVVALVSGPASGSLVLNPNGSFVYTPNPNFNGSDSFTYRANDGVADSNTVTVALTVNAVNDPPAAGNDSYTIDEDAVLNVAAPGVLANDSDVEGSTLVALRLSGPSNGTLALNANGSFTYTPNANFSGVDSFTYSANDGVASSSAATVTITVTAVNDVPVAAADAYVTNEDVALSVARPGVLGNDTDVEGGPLTAILVAGPASGSLTLSANGSFTYTPNANFNGSDSFTYRANDGTADSNTVTVSITVNAVNDVPSAGNDAYATDEDVALNVAAPGVLGNDADVEGSALTAVLVAGPSTGTLALNANGSFTYTPNANFNGTDSFTYGASDGSAASSTATVTITVNAVPDAPIATADTYTVDEDTSLAVAGPGVLGNDVDPDGDAITATLVTGPANGTLTLNANGSFDYTPNANFNGTDSFSYTVTDGTLVSAPATVTLTVNAVNDLPVANADSYTTGEDVTLNVAAPGVLGNDADTEGSVLTAVLVTAPANGTLTLNGDGSFSYTPNTNFNGTDSFVYRANDGTDDSGTASVTLTVTAVNDAPVAVADAHSTDEDVVLNVPAPGVLSNDSDAEGDALVAVLVSGTTSGALTLNANGSFSYTPNANFSGTDSFTYRAQDGALSSGTATVVTITVNAVNDPPAGAADAYNVFQNTALTVVAPGVLANDSDVEASPLTALLMSGPANGTLTLDADGSFTYTPNAGFSGPDAFVYRASDGAAQSADTTVSITVDANTAPTTVADAYSTDEDVALNVVAPGVLGNDTDPEAPPQTLSAVLVSGPANGSLTLNADGSFTYTPNANFNGTDTFDYAASDGATNGAAATVTITVNVLNDAPVLGGAGSTRVFTEGDAALTLEGGITVEDVDSTMASATVTISSGFHAADLLTLTPVGSITGVQTGNVLTVSGSGTPAEYQAVLRSVQYQNTSEDPTTDARTITWVVNDGTVDSNSVTTTVNVTAVNDAPVVTTSGGTTAFTENSPAVTVDAALTVTDVDDTELTSATVTITNVLDSGMETLAAPTLFGSATANYVAPTLTISGAATVAEYQAMLRAVTYNNSSEHPDTTNRTISFQVSDGTDPSNVALKLVGVTQFNDPPTADAAGPFTGQAGIGITFPAGTLGGSDVEPGTTVTITTAPVAQTNGIATINADGSFTFTPNSDATTASFQYEVCDDGLPAPGKCSAPVTVDFNPVNGPMIYFVKSAPAGAGNCTLTNECTLATALGAIGLNTNRRIFIGDNGSYSNAVPLNAMGWLVGQGATGTFDTLFGIATPAQGTLVARPPLGQAHPTVTNTLTVNASTVTRGVNIATSGVTAVNDGSAALINGVTISEGAISSTGAPALILTDVTSVNITVPALSSSASTASGVILTNTTGSITAGGVITNPAGAAMTISGGSIGITYTGSLTQGNNFALLDVGGGHDGTMTFNSGTLSATNGSGLQFSNADGSYGFNGTTTLNGGDAGIDIISGSDGVFTFASATSITNPTGTAFNINGGAANMTYNGTIYDNIGTIVAIANSTGGTKIFAGAIDDLDGTGDPIAGGTAGNGGGILLTNNTGATIRFNGGIDLSTGPAAAFTATGGGTVEVCDESGCNGDATGALVNKLTTTTAAALNVANTTIGAGDLEFRSISANGGSASGIIIDTTGSVGGLSVKGTGTAGSGGTIANKSGTNGNMNTGTGIYLNNVGGGVSLSRMQLNDFGNYAIYANNVSNAFALANSVINGTNGNSAADDEATVRFVNLTGNAAISGTSISGGFENNVKLNNNTGVLNRLTFSNVTIGANSTTDGNDGIGIEADGPAAVNVTVQNSFFTSSRGDLFQMNHIGTGTGDLIFTGNTLTNNHPGIGTGGGGVTLGSGSTSTVTMNVSNNTMRDAVGHAVLVVKDVGTGTLRLTFDNNDIGVAGVANSGSLEGAALKVQQAGQGTFTASITNNELRQYNNEGLVMQAGAGITHAGNFNLTVSGNIIANPGSNALISNVFQGLMLNNGVTPGDSFVTCLNLGPNTINGSGRNGGVDFRLRARQATTVQMPQYAGAANDTAAVATYAQTRIGGSPSGSALVDATSPGFVNTPGGAPCPTP